MQPTCLQSSQVPRPTLTTHNVSFSCVCTCTPLLHPTIYVYSKARWHHQDTIGRLYVYCIMYPVHHILGYIIRPCNPLLKVNYRVFALDIVSELLARPARQFEEGQLTEEEGERVQCKYLIKTILSRCSDKAAR